METLVTLEPRDDPNEVLQNGLLQRKPLEMRTTGATEIDLGRGSVTGIGDHSIGSSVVKVSLGSVGSEMAAWATLQRDAVMCKVHVNGLPFPPGQKSVYLNSGDIISLDGLRYEYRIHISELSGSASAPGSDPLGGELGIDSEDFWSTHSHLASPQETMSEPGVKISPMECSQLSEEIQCSVCLEIQVNSRAIHPCGHSVCAPCISKLSDCPQCRVKISSHIPNMQLKNLICKLVSIPSLLDAEDVKSYHERTKNAKVSPVVHLMPNSGIKRSRRSSARSTRSGFAFADMDDPFYMPPHLEPSITAAATARAVAAARSRRITHATNSQRWQYVPRSQPQQPVLLAPSLHPQAGDSLESAISID
ncbi:MAG: hypothetical protein SGBAC_012481 [Bacillariaceae sp.]